MRGKHNIYGAFCWCSIKTYAVELLVQNYQITQHHIPEDIISSCSFVALFREEF